MSAPEAAEQHHRGPFTSSSAWAATNDGEEVETMLQAYQPSRVRGHTALLFAFVISACTAPPATNIRVAVPFTDHMVVQRDVPITIWGWADPGGTVTVSMNDLEADALVGSDSTWRTSLPRLGAGGPYTLTVSGVDTTTFTDVLVGEVWIASGQSNMEWPLSATENAETAIAEANYPRIRILEVVRTGAYAPQQEVEATGWHSVTPETIAEFSAVGYYFGRKLYRDLDVPVGIIQTAWGGTPAEAWTSYEALNTLPDFTERVTAITSAVTAGESLALDDVVLQRDAGTLYNAMVAPLIPYTMRGVIWYQGESNASRAYQYRSLFQTMIQDWRGRWDLGDFPFYFVQLANFRPLQENPVEAQTWPELREAQTMALSLRNTAQAVIIDIGEADDIHPRNKLDVGERLARAALNQVHGQDIIFSGPVFREATPENGALRIRFEHTGSGLVARGGTLAGFAVAGEDREFYWAEARIDGETVVVSSPDVINPVAVRYGWADNPIISLFNAEGLPASPFRSDDWPGVTDPTQ